MTHAGPNRQQFSTCNVFLCPFCRDNNSEIWDARANKRWASLGHADARRTAIRQHPSAQARSSRSGGPETGITTADTCAAGNCSPSTPQSAWVLGAAVTANRLLRSHSRRHFVDRPAPCLQVSEKPAAVLVPLFEDPSDGKVHVVLTLRSSKLSSHSGEFSAGTLVAAQLLSQCGNDCFRVVQERCACRAARPSQAT